MREVETKPDLTHAWRVRYLDMENDAWDGMRRVALAAAGGGLAISFLVLAIKDSGFDVYLWFLDTLLFHFPVFPWLWTALLTTMLLGLVSYGLRAWGIRRTLKSPPRSADDPLPKMVVAERALIAAAGVMVFVAFVLIALAGIVLRQLQ